MMSSIHIKKKKCARCEEEKPLYEFYQQRSARDGLHSRCRECLKESRSETEVEILRRNSQPHVNWKKARS